MSTELNLDDAVAILERTPAALGALLRDVPEVWSRATEAEGTWSPYVVIGHLIHAERADWIPRVRHIIAGETRPFDPFDREAQFKEPSDTPLNELLDRFTDLRRRNIDDLIQMNLHPSDLARTGQHPDFGQVTLGQLLATWVVHDLDHIAQISRTMAKVYTHAVGPWRVYLSILRDREK
jgi:hypothetical protein